jgi:hypothetical protein
MKKGCGCLASLLVLGFLGFAAYRVFVPARVGGVPFSQLPAQTQKERRADANKLVEKIETVARAAKKNKRETFTLNVSEDQLNTLLQDRLRTEKFPIDDLRAGLSPGVLTLQGTVKYQGFDVPATLDGTLEAKDGTLDFKIQSLSLSGIPAPDKIKDKAESSIGDGLKKAFSKESNAHIDKVTIEAGKMTVEGRTGK